MLDGERALPLLRRVAGRRSRGAMDRLQEAGELFVVPLTQRRPLSSSLFPEDCHRSQSLRGCGVCVVSLVFGPTRSIEVVFVSSFVDTLPASSLLAPTKTPLRIEPYLRGRKGGRERRGASRPRSGSRSSRQSKPKGSK